jgi:hypothetical protein
MASQTDSDGSGHNSTDSLDPVACDIFSFLIKG